jgi:hypothetical protein
MHAPLARSDYYETSAPPDDHQPATNLPAARLAARREGRPQVVPTFTTESIKELGARPCPGGLDTDFDGSGHRYAVSVTDSWKSGVSTLTGELSAG